MIRTLLAACALMATTAAAAQSSRSGDAGGRRSGALVRYDEASVTLTGDDGKQIVLAMTPGWTVSRPRETTTATLAKGDFVATGNTPIDDRTGRSIEMRIFEPGYERDYGNRPAPNNNVETHGTVSAVTRTAAGVELDVTYPGGARHLIVPASLKVTRFDKLSRDVLKPAMPIRATLLQEADGVYRAGRLTLAP